MVEGEGVDVSLSHSRRFLRRGLQLFALALAGVLVAVVVGFYAENRANPLMPSGRWLGWTGFTVLLSVFVVRDRRQNWGRLSFWLVLAGLFVVHTALYTMAFQSIAVWPSIWFLPISIAEYPIFLLVLQWLGYRDHGRTASPRRQG
jgi:hypothetical protein